MEHFAERILDGPNNPVSDRTTKLEKIVVVILYMIILLNDKPRTRPNNQQLNA